MRRKLKLGAENLESRRLMAADVCMAIDAMPTEVDDAAQTCIAGDADPGGNARGSKSSHNKETPYKSRVFSQTVIMDTNQVLTDDIGVYVPFTMEMDQRSAHLGRTTTTGEGKLYINENFEVISVTASGTDVAANGDKLTWDWVTEDNSLGLGSGVGTWTGGTGRFENASGELRWDAWNEVVGEPVDGIITIHTTGVQSGTLTF